VLVQQIGQKLREVAGILQLISGPTILLPVNLKEICVRDGFQKQIDNMSPTGNQATDFRNGCVAIQADIRAKLLQAKVRPKDIKIRWREPASLVPTPQIAVFDVWVSGRLVELEVTQQRVLASHENVGDPQLIRAVWDVVNKLKP
jgi:hypothetical protein